MPSQPVSIGKLSAEVGLSQNWLRQLASSGQIPSTRTTGGHRRFDVEAVRAALKQREGRKGAVVSPTDSVVEPDRDPDWRRSFAIAGLEEHDVWTVVRDDLGLDTTSNAGAILQHAFNEMLNNAIDHSGGETVEIAVWADPEHLALRIQDDGVGVFSKVRRARNLPDESAAVAELTKGKVTTMPERHSGEGIFFTSKAADIFQLVAGRLRWTVDNLREDQALGQVASTVGTTVVVHVATDTSRVLRDVFGAFTDDQEFTRTRPRVKLFGLGTTFVSRSEARRLLQGMDDFAVVEIDFAGVADVGQGFVDEVFRVWPAQHPGSRTVPVNMNEAVEFMVRRGFPVPPPPTP